MDTLTSHAPTMEMCKDICSRASSSLWGRFDENSFAPTLRMSSTSLSLLLVGSVGLGYVWGRHGYESQIASAAALAAAKSAASDADGAEEASTRRAGAPTDGTTTARVRFAESLASTEQAPTPERTSDWVAEGGHDGSDGEEQTEPEGKGKQRAVEVDGDDSEATATGVSPTTKPRSLRLRIP